MKTYARAVVIALLVGCLAIPLQAKDIVETAVSAGNFETLVAAVKAAGLVETLQGKGPFTVFAPTDEAFAKLPEETLSALLRPENKSQLVAILTYHVVPEALPASSLFGQPAAQTVNGQQVRFAATASELRVNDARIVKTDIRCDNGIIHVIDSVILPGSEDIPTTAANAGSFETLIAAVKAAGLAETLSGEGPFTVFAPTDDAFAALPDGTVENLLKPENKQQLIDILKYHVLPGRVYARDAVSAGSARTLLGQPVQISVTGNGVRINDARLSQADLDATNGVIHVIDSVLLPADDPAADARRTLEEAVAKGSELFNSGHHGACAKLYMSTLETMLADSPDVLGHKMVSRLQDTVQKAKHTHDMSARAWVLRRGIDAAYTEMLPTPQAANN